MIKTQSPPKIVEIVNTSPAETFLYRHFESLRGNEYPVILLARYRIPGYPKSSSIGELTPEDGLIIPGYRHFSLKEIAQSLRYLFLNPKYIFIAHSFLNYAQLAFFARLKPDLIHFHNGTIATRMNWIPIALGVPYTLSLRGNDIQVHPLRSTKFKFQLAHAIKNASGIHSVCNQFQELLKEIAVDSVRPVTIYTTVPIPKQQSPRIMRRSNSPKFFTSGRLTWQKGYPDLLRAIADLGTGGLEAHLTIAGSGKDEERLYYWIRKLGLNNRVLLIGKVNQERIQ